MTPKQVWIVQPYIPTYRVPFFEQLRENLRKNDVDLHIVAGEPKGDQAARGDSTYLDWVEYVKPCSLKIGPAFFELSSTRKYWKDSDAVIVPHMGTSRDAFSALVRKKGMKVGVWGHIDSYVSAANPLDAIVEKWQLHRADQVFAYTPGGAEYAVAGGVPKSRITTVMNTVDTEELEMNLREVSVETITHFRQRHCIPDGPFFAFVGGLDSSKRIDFLAETLDALYEQGSKVHIVVGGSGKDDCLLEKFRMRGQVTSLGFVHGTEKATLLSAASAIVCPGRVGLLAVDALVAKRPILTTKFNRNAPEFEYLTFGKEYFSSENTPEDFAFMLKNPPVIRVDSENDSWNYPTISEMVTNFTKGVLKMLQIQATSK